VKAEPHSTLQRHPGGSGAGNVLRLVFSSRSTSAAQQWADDANDITRQSAAHNGSVGITGILLAGNGHYLQLLEGPPASLQPLYERIEGDRRHTAIDRLIVDNGSRTSTFPEWSCVLLERSELPATTEQRAERVRTELSRDPSLEMTDLFKLLVMPAATADRVRRESRVRAVALTSVSGLWDAAVIQGLATRQNVPIGRTRLAAPGSEQTRSLVEYVDLRSDSLGPVRVLTMAHDVASWPAAAALVDRLDVLVLMVSLADLPQFGDRLRAYAKLLLRHSPNARLLVLTSTAPEPLARATAPLTIETGLPIDVVKCRLGQAAAVWNAVELALAEQGPGRVELRPPSTPDRWQRMLERVTALEGFRQAALVRTHPPGVLALSSPANAQQMEDVAVWLSLNTSLLNRLQTDSAMEEIDVTTQHTLELLRPLPGLPDTVLVLELDRAATTLAAARLGLRDIESDLG
jgi:Sensors of blue-light using FAD